VSMSARAKADLDAALLDAHARGDRAALIALYAEASETAAEPVARAFYLTHAYVFALEAGDPSAIVLKARLVAEGADTEDARPPAAFPGHATSAAGDAPGRPAV
jgi:hypothetical protein